MEYETNSRQENFDLSKMYETERKFTPLYSDELRLLMGHESKMAIEQVYLSTPDEPFSLRLRSIAGDAGIVYEATLKDRGVVQSGGIRRLEVTTPVAADVYDFYTADATAKIRKLRIEPVPNVVVDFYDDDTVQIESEDESSWREFEAAYGISTREITGLPIGDNEQRAYRDVQFEAPAVVTAEDIIDEVLERREYTDSLIFVHVGGRSGSGKSTIVRGVVSGLVARGITSDVLSTDDYHRGQAWLRKYNDGQPWLHWDEPIVYDMEAMAADLETLCQRKSIQRRTIDWHAVEPRYESILHPPEVVVIEGIYALSPEITRPGSVTRELQTPLATCIGRRLLRDLHERPQFADPAASLSYMLNEVEPAYRRQRKSA